ncbi:MAG: hypothetical protein Q9195_000323 [Heterodermia aff. obscurata]
MAKTLSPKDTHILSLLSLPHPVHPPTHNPNPSYPSPNPNQPPPAPSHLTTHEASILAPLNHPSPPPSALHTAITHLNNLISSHPSHASAYNNRAQANRMLHGDDLRSEAVQKAHIWADLTQAIALAEGEEEEDERRQKVLSAAYTQRAWMVYKLARCCCDRASSTEENGDAQTGVLPAELQGSDSASLEEWASRDFEKGGRYGNGVAREMAKATNPYAKLCGAIVGEVLRREMGGDGELGG